jgi:hypothetical protein
VAVDGFATPLILVDRPGDGGTPSGGSCAFTNRSDPKDGPYTYYNNVYTSEYAARVQANKFGLLISPEAELKFVEVSEQNRQLEARIGSIADENRGLEAEVARLTGELEAERARAGKLEAQLVETRSAGDHFKKLFGSASAAGNGAKAGVR